MWDTFNIVYKNIRSFNIYYGNIAENLQFSRENSLVFLLWNINPKFYYILGIVGNA